MAKSFTSGVSNASRWPRVEQPFVTGDGHVGEPRAGALGQQLPRHEVAVMLHFREQDDVAGLQMSSRPRWRRPD